VLFSAMEPDGRGGSVRRYSLLPLERNKVAFFPLSWTVVHPIDDTSPLAGKTREALEQAQAEILVLLSGIDETFEQTVHARSSYRADEIVWNARFQSMFLAMDKRSHVSVDISRVAAAGDQLVAAAMLCVWAYGYGLVDAHAALADDGHHPRQHYLAVMDELWRALRGAPGLVEHADSLTRLNRAKGIASVMVTHSLADLDALPTEQDRAKAQGFIERAAIKVLAGLPPRELDRVGQVVRLGVAERELVSSWAAPEAWLPGARHPGRGKYLIKTGDRPGLPVSMTLVGDEHTLYDTDAATRIAS